MDRNTLIKLRSNNKNISHINSCIQAKVSNINVISSNIQGTNYDSNIYTDTNSKSIKYHLLSKGTVNTFKSNSDSNIIIDSSNNDPIISFSNVITNYNDFETDDSIEFNNIIETYDNDSITSSDVFLKNNDLRYHFLARGTINTLPNMIHIPTQSNIIDSNIDVETSECIEKNIKYNLLLRGTIDTFKNLPNIESSNSLVSSNNSESDKKYKTYHILGKNINTLKKKLDQIEITEPEPPVKVQENKINSKYNIIFGNKNITNFVNIDKLDISDKIVIPFLTCGLGNQMFILSAAYCISTFHNAEMHIYNYYGNEHNIYNYNYKENIFKYFGVHINKDQNNINKKYRVINNRCFEEYDVFNYSPPVILNGYFQYYPPLIKYENEIRNLFLSGLEPFFNKIYETYDKNNLENSAFLHVRRGDYLDDPKRRPICSTYYYSVCILDIINDVENIYVLSDDIEYIKKESLFNNNQKIKIFHSKDELYSLAFMSLCTKAAICANSTFSWWGAFLGAYKLRNKVFVPRDWIKTVQYDINKLVPDEWIKI